MDHIYTVLIILTILLNLFTTQITSLAIAETAVKEQRFKDRIRRINDAPIALLDEILLPALEVLVHRGLHEAVGVGNVVYVWTEIMNTDDATGQPVETHVVTRFQFNDDGKVAAIANMREDRFILEQQGFTISR